MAIKQKKGRFQVIKSEVASFGNSDIIRDEETGALYYFFEGVNGGGLTPLLDKEGKPAFMKEKK